MASAPPVAAVPRRDRIVILSCLAAVTALAWAELVHLDRQMAESMAHHVMMADMGMSMDMPWTLTDFWLTFAMWTVMMIGMMAGAAAPVLLLFAGATAARAPGRTRWPLLMFGAGYLMVWTGFSALATLAQWGMHEAALLSPAMAASNPLLAGAILIAAGIYQLTPFKGACLTHCRSPLGFLMGYWRDGATGALTMGLKHGVHCLGCCWALMGVLFAVGVMNLIWVAALTALVLVEKVAPGGAIVGRVGGIAMVVLGILFTAGWLP